MVIGVFAVVTILWAINRVWTDLQFYLDRMDGPNEPEAPPWWHFWKR
ncbi:MAG TPA: hypothetical protein VK689_23695 [Armatimonadota bacterium]|nr:hypothetical protein [Armatimonadota bacterium]